MGHHKSKNPFRSVSHAFHTAENSIKKEATKATRLARDETGFAVHEIQHSSFVSHLQSIPAEIKHAEGAVIAPVEKFSRQSIQTISHVPSEIQKGSLALPFLGSSSSSSSSSDAPNPSGAQTATSETSSSDDDKIKNMEIILPLTLGVVAMVFFFSLRH